MAGITLAQAETNLAAFLAASEACAANQEYRIAGRMYRRADLDKIQSMIEFWDKKVKQLSRGGPRIIGATPLDG